MSIVDKNGIDWVSDLIGNSDGFDGFDWDRATDTYTTSAEIYDWWDTYITDYQNDEEALDKLWNEIEGAHDYDTRVAAKDEYYDDYNLADYDMDMHHSVIQDAIAHFTNKYLGGERCAE